MMKDHEADGPLNEELKALEAHMLSISKQGKIHAILSISMSVVMKHKRVTYFHVIV